MIDSFRYEGAPPKGRDLRWDSEVPGFGVRIFPSGEVSFFVTFRALGRQRTMGLGLHGTVTLQQAREMARAAKVEVMRGKDPLDDRRRRHTGKTFGELAAAYRKNHLPHKRSARDDESMLDGHLKRWENLPLASIKRPDVAQLYRQVGETAPIRANRVLSLLSKMFNLAKEWGYLAETAPNPAKGVKRVFKEVKRRRFVTPDEMPRLAAAIELEPNPYIRVAIWLYLLTGLRRSELLRARWKDVDFVRKELRVPVTKSGEPHVVPITPHMEKLIKGLRKRARNPYVFPGHRRGHHLVEIKRSWETIRTNAGIPDVRIHDLRHTLASWLVSGGASLALAGRVLNHSSPAVTDRYAHFMTAPVALALEGHEKQLLAAASKKKEPAHHASPSSTPPAPSEGASD